MSPAPKTKTKQDVIKEFSTTKNDTGSTQVQIAIITQRINELTEHMKRHVKDMNSRHGLLRLVGQRKRLLSYLKTTNQPAYAKLIDALGIRG